VVGYYKSMTDAQKSKRVSTNPLVLKALKLAPESKTDIVLANSDVQKLTRKDSNLNYLTQGKVVIVID